MRVSSCDECGRDRDRESAEAGKGVTSGEAGGLWAIVWAVLAGFVVAGGRWRVGFFADGGKWAGEDPICESFPWEGQGAAARRGGQRGEGGKGAEGAEGTRSGRPTRRRFRSRSDRRQTLGSHFAPQPSSIPIVLWPCQLQYSTPYLSDGAMSGGRGYSWAGRGSKKSHNALRGPVSGGRRAGIGDRGGWLGAAEAGCGIRDVGCGMWEGREGSWAKERESG